MVYSDPSIPMSTIMLKWQICSIWRPCQSTWTLCDCHWHERQDIMHSWFLEEQSQMESKSSSLPWMWKVSIIAWQLGTNIFVNKPLFPWFQSSHRSESHAIWRHKSATSRKKLTNSCNQFYFRRFSAVGGYFPTPWKYSHTSNWSSLRIGTKDSHFLVDKARLWLLYCGYFTHHLSNDCELQTTRLKEL